MSYLLFFIMFICLRFAPYFHKGETFFDAASRDTVYSEVVLMYMCKESFRNNSTESISPSFPVILLYCMCRYNCHATECIIYSVLSCLNTMLFT
jgi:hypothetical protein